MRGKTTLADLTASPGLHHHQLPEPEQVQEERSIG